MQRVLIPMAVVSPIRRLDQPVDEPPDSPARAPPSRCLRGPTKASVARTFAVPRPSQSWQNRQQPRTSEERLLLFFLTEGGINGDLLTSVCEHCEILSWFTPDFQDRPKYSFAVPHHHRKCKARC